MRMTVPSTVYESLFAARMMAIAWSHGTSRSATSTVPLTVGSITMFSPLISANVRSTARRSAPCRSRLSGVPVYWVGVPVCSVGCRTAMAVDCVVDGRTDTYGAACGALTVGFLSRPSAAIGSAPRAVGVPISTPGAPAPPIALIASLAAALCVGGRT